MPEPVYMEGDPLAPHSLLATELKELLAAERNGEPFIVFRDGGNRLGFFVMKRADRSMTIGRRAEMDLPVTWDSEVSGLHAELHCLGGEWAIVDDGLSTNGTYLNAQRITGRQRLKDRDRIRVGRTILAFNAAKELPVAATVAAGDLPVPTELTETQRRVLISLCRPYRDGSSFATPATNSQIAAEVFLSVDAVKMHLRVLFGKFELSGLPQNQKRTKLAECALQFGVISQRDLA